MGFQISNGVLKKYTEEKDVTEIVIPDGVQKIGERAFSGCDNIKNVIIPDSVTSIGDSAFAFCSDLKNITIPNSVTSIGYSAFERCYNLTSITIPNSVTSIGKSTFYYCINLTSVTIPDSVTSIGNSAFSYCSSLTSVTIPDSVISIGDWAFKNCNLSSVIIPKAIRKVGQCSFHGCKEITVYDSIDPDAKPYKNHSDGYHGTPNASLGTVVNYFTNKKRLDYEITVRSAQTDEIKYKVWMGSDRTQGEYCNILESSWGRNATFNFNAVDEFFPKIKGMYHKIRVALNRLHYPIDLTDEHKEMYRSYIVRSAKNAVKLCIDTDDMEMMLDLEQLGVIKKNNINELLEYATEKKAVSFTAYLLEYKENHFNKGKNVLDSLKL